MFGLIKENIINNLANTYDENPGEFKTNFKEAIKSILGSEPILEFVRTYDAVKNSKFEKFEHAKLFIDETVAHLQMLDKSQLQELHDRFVTSTTYENGVNEHLDALVSENLSINDKVNHKLALINIVTTTTPKLTTEETIKIDLEPKYEKIFLSILNQKITNKLDQLTEDERKVFDVITKSESESMTTLQNDLIKENLDLLDAIKADAFYIHQVKERLSEMKSEIPTIESFNKLIELKTDLNDDISNSNNN